MTAPRRISAAVLTGALVLAACGGEDDTSADASDTEPPAAADETVDETAESTEDSAELTEDGGSDTTTDSPTDEPVPTIAPDLPEEFLAGVGPVAVVGEPLPAYPQDESPDPAVGMAAPVIIGETMAGEPIRIDAAVDGPTWLVFLAHWCPHCNDEIPVINQLRDDGGVPDGVNVVGVSTAFNPGRPNWPPDEWLDDKQWTFTAINDGVDTVAETYILASEFGIGGFPFSILVDGDGNVAERWEGEREPAEIEASLSNLALAS